ncbi:MAG TPA: ergothioneine biosynthesis protein EgtB [Myxococcaceae bacterium]|nr:ergothioneine biosynthesis protein EgtB [Myxococcaceae bacterium]
MDAAPKTLLSRYLEVRRRTERLAEPLSPEDQNLQSMPECSPVKWHRAHTTWFFETFLLGPRGQPPIHPEWGFLYNSYYEALGPRQSRPQRSLLSRPSAEEIARWRRQIDERMAPLLEGLEDREEDAALIPLVELGLAHEEQHQELLLTDVLNAFSHNALKPAYAPPASDTVPDTPALRSPSDAPVSAMRWLPQEGGLVTRGASGDGFAFDNERPAHRVFLQPYQLASRLVSVAELKAFIREGGYHTPSLWLSEGLEWVRAGGREAPLYGRMEGEAYVVFGLTGEREAGDDEPAVHLSFYEADAIATFLGARLPTEAEWEHVAQALPVEGHLLESGPWHATPPRGPGPSQLFGTAWEWTRSAYAPYPGFRPAAGAIGEYNGKFMVHQQVLRGGSYLTPPGHVRATYRNFWHPHVQFQVTGARLARDA